jgi:hypothetical protein
MMPHVQIEEDGTITVTHDDDSNEIIRSIGLTAHDIEFIDFAAGVEFQKMHKLGPKNMKAVVKKERIRRLLIKLDSANEELYADKPGDC